MRKVAILLFIVIHTFAGAQNFGKFLQRINSVPSQQRQAIADSFMSSGIAFPFIENDSTVHFIYNGTAKTVSLAGDATGWKPGKNFQQITGSNFWYATKKYEPDARLDYKLVINDTIWILDPKNPDTCFGGYGPNSELRMPRNSEPPEVDYVSNIPHGILTDTTFHSNSLGNDRHVKTYLPPGYPTGRDTYPVILFHDGPEYLKLCNANNTLDFLIAQNLIVPVIAIFIPPVDREEEYAGTKKDLFTAFIINELMPVIDNRYKTSRIPAHRAMIGASNGGNISMYIGVRHPEQFGKVAAQSGNVIGEISEAISDELKLNLSFYLDIGTYDINMLIPMVRSFNQLLEERSYRVQYLEWHEGHSWGNWKEHLRYPLLYFFHESLLNTN